MHYKKLIPNSMSFNCSYGALTLLIFEKSYSQNWIKSTELIIEDLLLKINGFYSNFRQNIV